MTIANDGTVWLLGAERVEGGHTILRGSGGGWRRIEGGAVALSVGRVPWLVNDQSHIYVRTGKR